MRKFIPVIICILISLMISSRSISAGYETGEAFIHSYSNKEYGAHPQNWAAIQDKRGVMYFGNSEGILEYDGVSWRLLDKSIPSARSLAIDKHGTIYMGGTDNIGYLYPGDKGNLKFFSLLDKIPDPHKSFGYVNKIHITSHGIYFFTQRKIFRLHNDSIEVTEFLCQPLSNCFDDIIYFVGINGVVMVVDEGKMWRFDQKETVDLIRNAGSVQFLPFSSDEILLVTGKKGFFLASFPDRKKRNSKTGLKLVLKPFSTQIDIFVKHNHHRTSIALGNQRYAIGTRNGGIAIIDGQGNLLQLTNMAQGLANNYVNDLYLDKHNNIWACLMIGISYIQISSPLTCFSNRSGLEDALLAVCRYQGDLYCGGFKGLFKMEPFRFRPAKTFQNFDRISNYKGSVWSLLDRKDLLLAAGSYGVWEIDGNRVRHIPASKHSFCLGTSPRFPRHIFSGGKAGVGILERQTGSDGNQTRFRYLGQLKNIDTYIYQILADKNGDLWLSTYNKGVIHVRFKDNNFEDIIVTHYGKDDGLPVKEVNYLYFYQDNFLVPSEKGFYTTNKPISQVADSRLHFVPEYRIGNILNENSVLTEKVYSGKNGSLFIDSGSGIGLLTRKENGKFEWNSLIFKKMDGFVMGHFQDEDGVTWLPTDEGDGLYRYNPGITKDYETGFNALIRRVILNNEEVVFDGAHCQTIPGEKHHIVCLNQNEKDNKVFPYKDNNILFQYAANFYEFPERNRYSFRLQGYDKKDSQWTPETKTKYTNLPEGNYIFQVRAQNVFQLESTQASYRFTILAPWYRTIYAYIGYFFGFLLIIFAGIRFNTRRLIAAKHRLENIVINRTAEVVKQKDELEVKKREIEEFATDLSSTNRKLTDAKNALWGEMKLAKKIQSALLPETPVIPGYDIVGYMKPADEVGGDYYDVINIAGRNWIVIGDVSGHGVPAGLIMMMVQSTVNLAMDTMPDSSPAKILEYVNRIIYKNILKLGEDKYMTITVFSCIENGKLYFSGLHQDIMIYRADKKDVELVKTNGMWIGIVDEIGSMLQVDQLGLNQEDVLFLYTDGITEAKNEDDKMYSDEKLVKVFKELGHLSPKEIKDGILNSLDSYTCNDDVTLLILKRA